MSNILIYVIYFLSSCFLESYVTNGQDDLKLPVHAHFQLSANILQGVTQTDTSVTLYIPHHVHLTHVRNTEAIFEKMFILVLRPLENC